MNLSEWDGLENQGKYSQLAISLIISIHYNLTITIEISFI